MLVFALRKLVQGVLLLLAVSAIAFGLLSAAGGDALTVLADNPQVSAETIERLRSVHGLDRPVAARYFSWLGGMAAGDLGESFIYRTPVSGIVISRLGNTALLALAALLIALTVALPAAYLGQRARSPVLDAAADHAVSLTASVPRIVLALIALLAVVSFTANALEDAARDTAVLLAASVVMAFPLIAVLLAQSKGELASAAGLAFVQFARAKGLSERALITRHMVREALNPILTLLGLSVGSLVSGSVVVETILGWPGIGALMVAAVRGRDVSLVMGIVVITSIAVWLGNSVAELLQHLNDPRLRAEGMSAG